MIAAVESAERRGGLRPLDRLAAAFLLVLLAAGSLVLWLGIPAGALWALSKLTESGNEHFLLSLIAIPTAMILFAPALFWLNGLYLRVIGVLRPEEDDEDRRWRLRGPLVPFLYAGMVVALVALVAWVFFFAETPPYTVW